MTNLETLIKGRLAHNRWGLLGNQGYVLGIDLGSYGLRAMLLDLSGQHISSVHQDLVVQAPDAVVEHALGLARSLLTQAHVTDDRLVRVGVGFNGPLDLRHGTVRLSPRMSGWENYPLQERFEQAFDAVTLIDNDANLIALAEATFGTGAGHQHLFYLHLSSGVGSGAVLNGRIYHGGSSMAGEIGHAVVGRGWDGSGRPETLEELASLGGLLKRAKQLGLQTTNLEDIFGDHPVGKQIVHEQVDLLAVRIAQTVALLDPEMVLLGGIVARIGGEAFVQAIATKVGDFIAPQFARPIPVLAASLGPDSVTIGALALALDSLAD
jgi:glucokinase